MPRTIREDIYAAFKSDDLSGLTLEDVTVGMPCCGKDYVFPLLESGPGSKSVPCPCGASGYWVVLRDG